MVLSFIKSRCVDSFWGVHFGWHRALKPGSRNDRIDLVGASRALLAAPRFGAPDADPDAGQDGVLPDGEERRVAQGGRESRPSWRRSTPRKRILMTGSSGCGRRQNSESTLHRRDHMKQRQSVARTLAMAVVLSASPMAAVAHFQELIPSAEIVDANTGNQVMLALSFTHPMARGPVMPMGRPAQFGVLGPTGREDLADSLRSTNLDGKTAYRADYRFRRPGDYVFYVEPAPYWEPGEGRMIVHYTKTVVDAFGAEAGWDAMVGFPVEIEPLVRPYGLWTGNLFRGIVRKGGEPVPFAEVEVEWRNDGSVRPPADPFITQVIKADAAGVFAYAMPRAGWWGFAALIEGDRPMTNPDGELVPVEQGALIWVRTRDMD
jgi:cobalt/nickel transport protein